MGDCRLGWGSTFRWAIFGRVLIKRWIIALELTLFFVRLYPAQAEIQEDLFRMDVSPHTRLYSLNPAPKKKPSTSGLSLSLTPSPGSSKLLVYRGPKRSQRWLSCSTLKLYSSISTKGVRCSLSLVRWWMLQWGSCVSGIERLTTKRLREKEVYLNSVFSLDQKEVR